MSSVVETQSPEVVDQAAETHDKKSPQESFAELRKAKEDIEREAWQAKQELKWYKEQQLQAQQKPQAPQEEDYDYRQLEKEEFPDGKNLVKALNTFNKKLSGYEQKLAEKDQKIQILETATEFADFKDVVTAENIEKYIKSDEDNREAVEYAQATGKNPLRKVYNLIKKSAAYQAETATKAVKDKPISQEQKRVNDKEGVPKTGSLGVRSEAVQAAAKLSNSTMTKEMRNSLWKETLAAARK